MDICELNTHRCVYLIGIGGISMSSLAQILHEKGFTVKGYDRNDSETVLKLREQGISVWNDHDETAFQNVDLICYSAAIAQDDPQMVFARRSGAKIISRAELLGCIAASYTRSVAVAGTHGKSTTSGMLSHIFMHSDHCDPTVLVGAVLPEVKSTYRIGSDEHFIFEACEYKDSFLSFYPKIAVVLNVELDHTDYFHSMEQMIGSFTKFMNNTGENGICVINHDCYNCMRAAQGFYGKKITFSALGNPNASFYAENIDLSDGFASFDVYHEKQLFSQIKLNVPGLHNVSNALASVAVAVECGLSPEEIQKNITTFTGVHRRFEYLGSYHGARFYDDYAHHPDEIKATLAAAKNLTKGRVICAFQPHNYSRLHDLFDDFTTAFSDADLLILTQLYAARESAGTEVSSELLANKTGATYIEKKEDISDYLLSIANPGDTVLIMGAGNIEEVAEKIKKSVKIT